MLRSLGVCAALFAFLSVLVRWMPLALLPGLLCRAGEQCRVMTRHEYRARLVLTKVADLLLRSPGLWHPGPSRLGAVVREHLEAKVQSGSEFVKLQIGANDLSHGDSSYAQGAYPDLVSELLGSHQGHHRLIFVEANPSLEEPLRRNVARLFPGLNRTQVISAAVCESDASSVPFYRLSSQFFEEHPELRHLSQMSSLDKTWIQQCQLAIPHVNLSQSWEETSVRCLTPSGLLAEAGLAPRDVDFLTLDVEGLEMQLLGLFLALDGFAPVALEFDAFTVKYAQQGSRFAEESLAPMLAWLAARGYDVHHSADGIVALRA